MSQARPEPTETTTLLQSEVTDEIRESGDDEIQNQHDNAGSAPWTKDAIRIATLATVFLVLFALADIFKYVSTIPLLELSICREYYPQHDPNIIPDHLCKTPEVQQRLAHLRGYLSALEAVVGLVLTLPYGLLVDYYGERLIAGANIVGYLLSCGWIAAVCCAGLGLPIRAVVFAPLFRSIGGGAPVLVSVVYSIAAKHVPGPKRSLCFFVFLGANLLTSVVAAQIAAALLDRGRLLVPLMLNVPLCLICLLVLAMMPRTESSDHSEAAEASVLALGEDHNVEGKWEIFASLRRSTVVMVHVLRDHNVLLLLAIVPVAKASNSVAELMFQYVPKRFDQSFAAVSRILSISTFESLIWLLFILPFIKNILQNRYQVEFTRVDLYIVQYGCLVQSLGCLVMAVSQKLPLFITGLLIFSLGCSTRAALQSLVTGQVKREHISILYTIMAIGDGVGSAVDALVLNRAFSLALGWDDVVYLGLPFLIGGICFLMAFGGSLFARHR